jgi:predicted nucleotidyltransferase
LTKRVVLKTFKGSGVRPGVDLIRSAALAGVPEAGEEIMERSEALSLLARAKPALAREFGVVDLALFGSVARNAARPDSDVDVLVAFNGPATSARFFGVLFYLEDLFHRPVDLVTTKALRPELRPRVEGEAAHV